MNRAFPGAEKDYFSPGFRKFVVAIFPHRDRSEARFPYRCQQTKISPHESVHGWFTRIVDQHLGGGVEACAVEPNMGVFAHLVYQDGLIAYANIQVIVVEAELEMFYFDEKTPCSYFRFDYHPGCLGEMFKEPLPHVHTIPQGAPRFGQLIHHGNVVMDFFDFIYRNYHHDKWLAWARYAYRRASISALEEDVFQPIVEAFKAGKYQELVSVHGNALAQMKSACRALKDDLFTAKIDVTMAAILGYESSPL